LIATQKQLAAMCHRLTAEKQRSEELLTNMLPRPIAAELASSGSVQAVHYDLAAVMFADFCGFTALAAGYEPARLVRELNICYSRFDQICEKFGVEKIKTIGDCYMAISGILDHRPGYAVQLVKAATAIRNYVAARAAEHAAREEPYWNVRIGLHAGPLVAGVVGLKKITFDVWGDTVNTASRVESAGAAGRLNATRPFIDLVRDEADFEPRGLVEIKGKESLEMFWIEGLKS